MKRALALTILFLSTSLLLAQSDWRQPFDPVKIVGNVYYVGTHGLSSFLIVTPAGGIIIDAGEAESVPFIRANVEKLGFSLANVRILLAGHAHFDHVGGLADLQKLTGAKVMVMDADRDAIVTGTDKSALGSRGWKAVAVDRVLHDGDTVTLGGTTLMAHLTPGHTQGGTTWTMEAEQDGKKYQVAFLGSVSINDGVHLVGNTRVPDIAAQYARAFRVLHELKPDIWVAQHGEVFGLVEKAKRVSPDQKVNPFVDPAGYQRLVEHSEELFKKQLADEQKK